MRWTPIFDYLFTPISTPKWHENIWFCMKFYELSISKNLVTMRFYGLLLRYIDLWKKANLQRYLISFLLYLLKNPRIYQRFSPFFVFFMYQFLLFLILTAFFIFQHIKQIPMQSFIIAYKPYLFNQNVPYFLLTLNEKVNSACPKFSKTLFQKKFLELLQNVLSCP